MRLVKFVVAFVLVCGWGTAYAQDKGDVEVMGFGVDVDSHGFSLDVNLHYLFPQMNTPKFTSYVLGGIGYLRASASATVGGSTVDASASDTGLNIGGGARWQVGSRWGSNRKLKF